MEKQFVADAGFPHELLRSKAKGYKAIHIAEDVAMPCALEFKTGDNAILNIEAVPFSGNEPDAYTILCKEFGLVGENIKFSSDISVIFCDDGWMLVTLHKGGFILNLEDRLLFASIGITEAPACDEDRILWVNADMLKGYAKYWGDKGNFVYDFEFFFTVSGGTIRGCKSFRLQHIDENDIDMSLGAFAQYQSQQEAKARLSQSKKALAFMGSATGAVEFDEDDDDEEFDDYDDDDY